MRAGRRGQVIGALVGFILGFFANQLSGEMAYLPGSALLVVIALLAGDQLLRSDGGNVGGSRPVRPARRWASVLLYSIAGLVPICVAVGILLVSVTMEVTGSDGTRTGGISTPFDTVFSLHLYEPITYCEVLVFLIVGSLFIRGGTLRAYGAASVGAGVALGEMVIRSDENVFVASLVYWCCLTVIAEWVIAIGVRSTGQWLRTLVGAAAQTRQ